VEAKVDPSTKVISMKGDCAIIGIFIPESVNFKKDDSKIPENCTFYEAKIKDGDTIQLEMDRYVSDPNIFESVFTRNHYDCKNPRC